MEMVVGNFLNIFAVSAIIILIIILLMGLSYHFRFIKINLEAGSLYYTCSINRTIDINTGLPYEDGRVNAIKSLMFQASCETALQLYGFITNPALRFTVKQY